MKFVIRSLLFVNLILQMTTSLKRCFTHDQSLIFAIILLAFTLIGLIGLIIDNRCILIIFAALITVTLLTSLIIYGIKRSEKDDSQPKVPYYVDVPLSSINQRGREDNKHKGAGGETNRIKSFVNKLLNKNQQSSKDKKTINNNRNKERIHNRTNTILNNNELRLNARSSLNSISTTKIMITPNDDYTDETPLTVPLNQLSDFANSRSSLSNNKQQDDIIKPLIGNDNQDDVPLENKMNRLSKIGDKESGRNDDQSDLNSQIQDEQWIVYERHIYEEYLNIVSQSIDLVLHIILSIWMALLLDEDSDKCFGPNSGKSARKSKQGHTPKEVPVYNYNGVRYSIRPDTNDSPTRIVVR